MRFHRAVSTHERCSMQRRLAESGNFHDGEFCNGNRKNGSPDQRTFPPFVVQSLALAIVQPIPLQVFFPLHEDKAVLHELVPLHELMPLHFTDSSARAAVVAPAANKAAADAARRVNLPISTSVTR